MAETDERTGVYTAPVSMNGLSGSSSGDATVYETSVTAQDRTLHTITDGSLKRINDTEYEYTFEDGTVMTYTSEDPEFPDYFGAWLDADGNVKGRPESSVNAVSSISPVVTEGSGNIRSGIDGQNYKCPPAIPDGAPFMNGVDVSEFQGNINWAGLRSKGVQFAFIRVAKRLYGSGALADDKLFVQNIKGARNA
jgi:hypothetical protein